ncbi:hypothetical protein OsI_26020 [Oryza sativa Indica Group]|uniref:Uncharacterized protein n=1 Tax=Oryza sativa subsp. indica TaxID=39946 RepID=B8B691_ORYSI|nr:hypothetical protein OsI_26020 [Oryza sativa Indica Group]
MAAALDLGPRGWACLGCVWRPGKRMRCREGDRQRRLTLAPRPASPTTGSRYRCLSLEGEGEGEVAGEEEDASSANEQGTFALSLLTGVSQDTQTTIKSVDELKEDFWSQLGYPKESRWWEQDSMPADNKTSPPPCAILRTPRWPAAQRCHPGARLLHHRTRTARFRGTDKDRERFRLLLLRKTQDGKEGTMTKIIGAHRMLDVDIRTRQATIVARISRAGASTGNTEDRNTVLSITG